MLDLEARFSPRIIPASTEYPYGKLKPNTTPAENDGTPVAADTGNDIEGFKQSVVTRANIDPSGIPDNAINSQLLDGLDKRYLEIDYQPWTFATGGLLIDCSQAAKHTNNKWYSWSGVFPEGGKVVAAGTDPTVDVGYVSRVTPFEHLPIVGASSADNTGTTYVQDLTFDTYGHVTGLVSTEIREGNTSQTGIVQLTDSTGSTSTTTAATPNSVKNAYDLASAAIPSTQKGDVGGVATLDGSGKVPTAQLPSAYEIGAVPLTRTVNSKPLSEDVTITALDVNAAPSSHVGATGTAHGVATTSVAGFMSSADKVKLDSMASGGGYTHPASGITAGTYKSVTVDVNGHVTDGTNPTTLSGYGITDALGISANAVSASKWSTARTLTFTGGSTGSGSIDGSGNVSIAMTVPPTGHVHALRTIFDSPYKEAADVATTAALTVTATTTTLTNSGTKAALVLDGVTCTVNMRVLVKNQANTAQNGIYTVTNVGSASVAWVLTRSTDADTAAEIAGAVITVDLGTVNGAGLFTNDFKATSTIGTTGMLWKPLVDTGNFSDIHPDSGVTDGTYTSVTVNAKGHVTAGTNPTTLSEYGITNAVVNTTTINGKPLTTNITLTAADVGAQPATSDSRVKSNIASLSPVLDKIMLIDPKTFSMEGREGTCVGTIAQDWEVDFPEVILNVPSTAQGEPEVLKGIDALGTIGILLKAIQELKGEIEDLKNR